MTSGPAYTPEEDAKLRELYGRRVSMRLISTTMGRSKQSIIGRLRNLGIKRQNRVWTPEDDDQLRLLFLSHASDMDIAKAIDRTASATRKRIFDLGLHRDGRKTRLASRYGMEVIANGKDPAAILAEIREHEELRREAVVAEQQSKINALLDEMERGLNAGCDRSFMFAAALVGGATLQAIAERVGITRERVRQVIEKRAETIPEDQG